jgi:hypothetical protein
MANQRHHEAGKLGLGNTRQFGLQQRRQDPGTPQHRSPGVVTLNGHQHLHYLVSRNSVLDALLNG